MNHLHWMKLYIGDELSNTGHMTPAEFGCYILLKMHYWRFGCLPNDDGRLARIARVSDLEWGVVKPSIGPLFDDDWRDPKLEAQRNEAEDRHKKLSEAGKRGGRPKKDEKGGYKPGFSQEKASHDAWPKQPEPEPDPYSDPASDPEPAYSALEGRRDTYPRERSTSIFTPIDPPSSPKLSAAYLKSRGIPDSALSRAVEMHMDGELTEYDIEGMLKGDVHEGAA